MSVGSEEGGRGRPKLELFDREMEEEAEDGPRVLDWEIGLPTGDVLIPLAQPLVPPELAAAFRIPPADLKTTLELHHAAHLTISSLTRFPHKPSSSQDLDDDDDDRSVIPPPDPSADENSDRALKRQRLVWTPQLHRRFVDVVAHLGVKNAVPKTIMQMMNVEGLTRENVAIHLQKYRLYLKRMQGRTSEASSSSDHLLASTHLPQEQQMPVPMIPMPIDSMPNQHTYAIPFVGFDDRYPHVQNNW